ncbi:MAG: hypothetical protein WA110_09755 [Anaerolineaceae bacterium]
MRALATEQARAAYPDRTIEIFDSKLAAIPEGIIAVILKTLNTWHAAGALARLPI